MKEIYPAAIGHLVYAIASTQSEACYETPDLFASIYIACSRQTLTLTDYCSTMKSIAQIVGDRDKQLERDILQMMENPHHYDLLLPKMWMGRPVTQLPTQLAKLLGPLKDFLEDDEDKLDNFFECTENLTMLMCMYDEFSYEHRDNFYYEGIVKPNEKFHQKYDQLYFSRAYDDDLPPLYFIRQYYIFENFESKTYEEYLNKFSFMAQFVDREDLSVDILSLLKMRKETYETFVIEEKCLRFNMLRVAQSNRDDALSMRRKSCWYLGGKSNFY